MSSDCRGMSAWRYRVVCGVASLCVLGSGILALPIHRTATGETATSSVLLSPKPGESDAAFDLRQAWQYRKQAWQVMYRELEAIEARDPELMATDTEEQLRLRQEVMARDASGDLGVSYSLARLAEKQAQSVQERYRAAQLLMGIECERGNHLAEQRWAQALSALAPEGDPRLWLQHLQWCCKRDR